MSMKVNNLLIETQKSLDFALLTEKGITSFGADNETVKTVEGLRAKHQEITKQAAELSSSTKLIDSTGLKDRVTLGTIKGVLTQLDLEISKCNDLMVKRQSFQQKSRGKVLEGQQKEISNLLSRSVALSSQIEKAKAERESNKNDYLVFEKMYQSGEYDRNELEKDMLPLLQKDRELKEAIDGFEKILNYCMTQCSLKNAEFKKTYEQETDLVVKIPYKAAYELMGKTKEQLIDSLQKK